MSGIHLSFLKMGTCLKQQEEMDTDKYSGGDMQRKITLDIYNRKFKVQEQPQNKTNDSEKQLKVANCCQPYCRWE